MLDLRVYRAAFLPALVALFVVAFSLSDPAKPRTTHLAPDAFDASRAFGDAEPPQRNSLRELAAAFPDRRPGSSGDAALADRVAAALRATGFAGPGGVRREAFVGDTVEGRRDLEDVVATRQGLSSRSILVIAHRDALGKPATAELSGTAALLELARVLADRDLRKTVVLASVSGGSGGFAGARRVAEQLPGQVDAVLVLGDLASRSRRRPFVVPWADGREPAPYGLVRTAQSALREEFAGDPGRDRAIVQWIRRAVPLSLSEQGAVGADGLPAIRLSATGERPPLADAAVSEGSMRVFGRAALRTLTATLEAGGIEADPPERQRAAVFPGGDGIVTMKRLLPEWAIRLFVLALLLPALLAAFDAFFRARRRGLPVGRWLLWLASLLAAPLAAWAWARAFDVAGGVVALPTPAPPGSVPVTAAGVVAVVTTVTVGAGVAFAVRALLTSRAAPRDNPAAGAAAAASGLSLSVLVAVVWVVNPYAAAALLPAAHAWLLATARPAPPRRAVGVLAVAAGLVLPLAVVAYYAHAWGLGPLDVAWTAFGLLAGGVLGAGQVLTLSAVLAALWATIVILRARRPAARPPAGSEPIVTRGPLTYAGPGSLGGTESALRR